MTESLIWFEGAAFWDKLFQSGGEELYQGFYNWAVEQCETHNVPAENGECVLQKPTTATVVNSSSMETFPCCYIGMYDTTKQNSDGTYPRFATIALIYDEANDRFTQMVPCQDSFTLN